MFQEVYPNQTKINNQCYAIEIVQMRNRTLSNAFLDFTLKFNNVGEKCFFECTTAACVLCQSIFQHCASMDRKGCPQDAKNRITIFNARLYIRFYF